MAELAVGGFVRGPACGAETNREGSARGGRPPEALKLDRIIVCVVDGPKAWV